jgi:hypothetical protein
MKCPYLTGGKASKHILKLSTALSKPPSYLQFLRAGEASTLFVT